MRLPVTSFTLDNGLEVVVIEDHRAPVVTHMVWYRVGSADEPPGQGGIAHFLEHLMFKGTDTISPGEFSEQVALNGGSDNAFTAQDYTAYHQRIAADRLELVMTLEADRMANLKLSEEEVATEREVILEERASRIGNNPQAQLGEQMAAALYLAHPYMRPIIGWEHEMRELSLEDAIGYYDRFYTPSNAILVVAGDVTPETVRTLAEATYGELENRFEVGPRVRLQEPPQPASRRALLEHPQAGPERLRRAYLTPSYSTAAEGEGEALSLLGQILGGGPASRLYRELVIEQGIAVDAGAYYAGTGLDYGEFVVSAVRSSDATIEEVEAAIDAIIAEVVAEGVTEAELERAKTKLVAESVFDQDSQSRMARTFGAALTTGSTVEEVISWPDDVRAATAESVDKAAADWLRIERSVTGILREPEGGEADAATGAVAPPTIDDASGEDPS